MNKIVSGVLGLVMVLALTAGSAYALFSDSATVSGVTLTTGSTDLQVKLADGSDTYDSTLDLSTHVFETLSPGQETVPLAFDVRNSATDNVTLDLTGLLTSAAGDWGVLSPVLKMAIYKSTDTATTGATTGWKTLTEWNNAPVALPLSPLAQNGENNYKVSFMLDTSADNSVQGKTLSSVVVVLTGTQP